ncbi:hypothetical protein L596_025302 [Steinernema carpocapsae]|uniref:Galectin n=1 Tax=Steinernema carpocapsae TaxID=34508 RepID=A0A4U5M888_STECR|nr:hypothetical protein L596_025302 [Steinernema carpocapsae]
MVQPQRFHNPNLPFHRDLIAPLTPGSSVEISGQAYNDLIKTGFMMDLQTHTNIALSLAAHFRPAPEYSCFLVLTASKQAFGQRHECGLVLGRPFKMLLTCQEHCFEVYIDGTHICDFDRRSNPDLVRKMAIRGSLALHDVVINFSSRQSNQPKPNAYPSLPGQQSYEPPPVYMEKRPRLEDNLPPPPPLASFPTANSVPVSGYSAAPGYSGPYGPPTTHQFPPPPSMPRYPLKDQFPGGNCPYPSGGSVDFPMPNSGHQNDFKKPIPVPYVEPKSGPACTCSYSSSGSLYPNHCPRCASTRSHMVITRNFSGQNVPCILQLGSQFFEHPAKLYISGTPEFSFFNSGAKNRFEINLKSGSEFIMHFNVRHDEKATVINSTRCGMWEQEARLPFSGIFKSERRVLIEILAGNPIQVKVDGSNFACFTPRSQKPIDCIEIKNLCLYEVKLVRS